METDFNCKKACTERCITSITSVDKEKNAAQFWQTTLGVHWHQEYTNTSTACGTASSSFESASKQVQIHTTSTVLYCLGGPRCEYLTKSWPGFSPHLTEHVKFSTWHWTRYQKDWYERPSTHLTGSHPSNSHYTYHCFSKIYIHVPTKAIVIK